MHITLSPIRSDATLAVVKHGDILTINGVAYDFTPLPERTTLPLSAFGQFVLGHGQIGPGPDEASAVYFQFVAGPVERIDGVLHLTLLLPHGADASEAMRFPAPIINPADGPLELPQ